MIETLAERIGQLGRTMPGRPAVAFKKELLTYGELAERMRTIGGRLVELGVKRGDRVLFSATSKPEAVAVYLGIQYAGAVAVFIDKNATAANAALIYEATGAAVFFTDKPMKGFDACRTYSLRKLFSDPCGTEAEYLRPGEDDLAEMIYTSGTTGRPKGVMLTYKNIYAIWTNTIQGVGMLPEDRILLPLPLNHSFALRVLRAGLYLGALVVLQNGFTFAKEIENNLNLYACTAIAIVPASVETISRQMQDKFAQVMGRFRYIEVSAGSLNVEQRRRMTGLLPDTRIINTWGSSESGGALFLNVNEAVKSERTVSALGKPLIGSVEIRTLDEQGQPFVSDAAHPGRMALRGDMQMAGYWNDPEQTAATLRDGWLLTGDMIYIDPDGTVFMLGRADDIINVGGEKVSPLEVENAAAGYEHLSECACIGVPDPEGVLGFVPVLFTVPRSSAYSQEELARFLAGHLERYKLPARYVELLELPRNNMQKIDRKALKVLWENGGAESPVNAAIQVLLTRRSVRKFQDRPIPRELLEILLKAGIYAPSGHNMQTWRFTAVTDPEKLRQLKEATVTAARENGVYCYGFENPAAVILVSNDSRNPYGCQDASCASENIMLAAWSYGIGSVWLNPLMTLRSKEPVKSLLDAWGVPENHTVWSMLSLGYPVAEGTLLKKKTDVIRWI